MTNRAKAFGLGAAIFFVIGFAHADSRLPVNPNPIKVFVKYLSVIGEQVSQACRIH